MTFSKTFLQVGVSACLSGEPVRYDGGHKRNTILLNEIGQHFELVPICPEVAIGMGVPRPPLHLLQMATGLRAVGVEDAELDVTDLLNRYAAQTLSALSGLSGYIFKCRSPSCGVTDVAVHSPAGEVIKQGPGLFAAAVIKAYPGLPVIDETALAMSAGLSDFIRRVEQYGQQK